MRGRPRARNARSRRPKGLLMTSLVLALALVAGIVAGALFPEAPAWAALGAGLVAIVLGFLGVFGLRREGRNRARWMSAGLLLAGLGLLRGWGASHELATPTVVIPRGLVAVEVVGASVPGPRCRLKVEVGGERWLLDSDPEECPRASGDLLWLRAEEVSRADANVLPWRERGFADPRSGSSRRIFVDRLWPASEPERGLGGHYYRWVAALRQRAWELTRGWAEGSLVVASALGMPSALPPKRRGEVRAAGLGHLLAVSGLHVALAGLMICGVISRVFAAFGWDRPEIGLVGLIPVIAYVLLTGGAPSALRAGVMLFLVLLSAAVGRPSHGPTVLALTAAGLLVVWPLWAVDPGFQMSLAAMAALVHPRAPRGILAQSWRVTWATLPVALLHFGGGSLLGVIANLIALPVFCAWVLPMGILGALGLSVFGAPALAPASWGAALILDVSGVLAGLPTIPALGLAVVAFGLMAASVLFRPGRRLFARGATSSGWSLRAPPWRGWAPIPGWCPPTWGLVLVILIAVFQQTSPELDRTELADDGLWAIGGGRRLEVIVPAIAGGEREGICIADPWLSRAAISGVLEHLGQPRVIEVRDPRSPPEIAERRKILEQLGAWSPREAGEHVSCRWPEIEPRELRRLLRRCRAAAGAHTALIRSLAGGRIECWRRDGWHSLPAENLDVEGKGAS